MPLNSDQATIEELAKQDENIQRHLEDFKIVKVIYVPNKLINFIVGK